MPDFVDIGIDRYNFYGIKVMHVRSENCKKNHRIPLPKVNTIKLFDAVSFYILN